MLDCTLTVPVLSAPLRTVRPGLRGEVPRLLRLPTTHRSITAPAPVLAHRRMARRRRRRGHAASRATSARNGTRRRPPSVLSAATLTRPGAVRRKPPRQRELPCGPRRREAVRPGPRQCAATDVCGPRNARSGPMEWSEGGEDRADQWEALLGRPNCATGCRARWCQQVRSAVGAG